MKKKFCPAKVAVVKCSSYDQKKVDAAIGKALDLIKFDFCKGMKVLVKPNMVGSFTKEKQLAITTNKSLVEAVCKILRKHKCEIYIGDSSFMATDVTFRTTGLDKVAKKYAFTKKPTIFEQEKLKTIRDPSARVIRKFPVAKLVKDVDLIINMPKMKTHSLAHATLGIKNLYGLIPGGLKQRLHNKAHGNRFSEILVDIYQNVKPDVNRRT